MNDMHDHFKVDPDGTPYAGYHLLVELWGAERLADSAFIRESLERAARSARATVLHSHFHHFGEGQGISGVVLLAESHISIHTWPERGYAAIDVFMCGDCDPRATLPVIEAAFSPERTESQLVLRGFEPGVAMKSVA